LFGFRLSSSPLRKLDGSSRLFSLNKKSHGIVIETSEDHGYDEEDKVMLPLDDKDEEPDEYKRIV